MRFGRFTDHITDHNSVDQHVKFTREDISNNRLTFLDCAIIIKVDKTSQTHIDQYLRPPF